MDWLNAIWMVSLVLTGVSLTLAFALILRRALMDLVERRRQPRRAQLASLIMMVMEDDAMPSALAVGLRRREFTLVAEIVSEYLDLVEGAPRARLIRLLEALGMVNWLVDRVSRGSPRDRVMAAGLLGHYDYVDVVEALESQLNHRSTQVRLAAALALTELGEVQSVIRLVRRMSAGRGFRSNSLFVLFRRLLPEYTMELIDILHSEVPVFLKALAIDAFGHSADYRAVNALTGFVNHDNAMIRAQTLRALARLTHPSALPAVVPALMDPDWRVRAEAAMCLAAIGADDHLRDLTTQLDDAVWWVRFRAAEALYGMGEKGILALDQASSGTSLAGNMAAQYLAERRSV